MLQQIAPRYIDTGKAKVVYHHFAFIGQESTWAGEAADCAMDQGKFWPYSLYLLSHQAGENQGAFSKNNLKVFAQQLGLDTNAFNTCLDSDKYLDAVKQETSQAEQQGFSGTPTFIINGQRITYLPTADQFGTLIDSYQK